VAAVRLNQRRSEKWHETEAMHGRKVPLSLGTEGSNPALSSRESAANLAPSIRCRWPPLPSHFSLLSPIAAPAPASAEAPIQAATMVTHYRTATINGVSIFYREAGSADGPVFLLLYGFPTSSPTA
jgi:hypothetical protein